MTDGLKKFKTQRRNSNCHTPRGYKELDASIRKDGWIGAMTVAADGETFDGSARMEKAADIFGLDVEPLVVHTTGDRPVIVVRDDIPNTDDKRAQRLSLRANRVAEINLSWDVETLAGFDADVLGGLWTPEELSDMLPQEDTGDDPGAHMDKLTWRDVPDAIFPTDNDLGIPLLSLEMQATHLVAPVQPWGMGAGARSRTMPGTWHFYTEDYRFEALWSDPMPVVNSGCVALVEPNFSAYIEMPRAVVLWGVYRKRWLARWWQSMGVRVLVDLNVAEVHQEDNLLGVPKGWKAWATRGYSARLDATEREFETACAHAGTREILFFVYGGGKAVQKRCRERGWLHVIEQRDAAKEKGDGEG